MPHLVTGDAARPSATARRLRGALAPGAGGAWLIVRPPHEPRHARVRFYDRQRAGVVIGISIYDADSGRPIATERPDEKRGEAGKTRPGG